VTRTYGSAGLSVAFDCAPATVAAILEEAVAGEPQLAGTVTADVTVRVEASRSAFRTAGWSPLTRGAWASHGRVILENAGSSGLDVLVEPSGSGLTVLARNRPGLSTRTLSAAARSRHHLLVRAVLLQYPLLWWAGVTGQVPLHVSAVFVNGVGTVLAGPGGTGKSTLLRAELDAGADAVSDNLCVTDGSRLFGVVEPLRVTSGSGRRMPHGRREASWPRRVAALTPDRILVLRRGEQPEVLVRAVPAAQVARALEAGTYAAGELRRYWAFAATLALGTDLGPAHPPIGALAARLAARVPCAEVVLPARLGTRLTDLSFEGVAA
jgi:hypothetical protein